MKIPFWCEVPNFKALVLEEIGETDDMSAKQRDEYIGKLVHRRATIWSCKNTADNRNLILIGFALGIMFNGKQLLELAQAIIKNLLGA